MKEREGPDYEAFVALRHEMRAERSRPIFDKFHAWLEAERRRFCQRAQSAKRFSMR